MSAIHAVDLRGALLQTADDEGIAALYPLREFRFAPTLQRSSNSKKCALSPIPLKSTFGFRKAQRAFSSSSVEYTYQRSSFGL